MKTWLKRNGKRIIIGLGTLAIANGIYGIINTSTAWIIISHSIAITLWVFLILLLLGILHRIYRWWEKD